MKKATKRYAVGTLLALAAGYVAGVLTAPKSGRETRQDIKDTTARGINAAEKELKSLHTQLAEVLGQAKDRAGTASGNAKTELDNAIETAKAAKEKAREILSAIHEGDAEDKELQRAIRDSKKALDHLRTYLAK
jgi:gas vesicle protein